MSPPSPPMYRQRPRVPAPLRWGPVAFLGVCLVALAVEGRDLDLRAVAITMAGTALLTGLVAALVLPRTWRTVEVDADGLHVSGGLVVPSSRIGLLQVLDPVQARNRSTTLTRGRGTGIRHRQNLYGGPVGAGAAVAVQELDERGAWRSTWLLPAPDPDALVAALSAAADLAPRP